MKYALARRTVLSASLLFALAAGAEAEADGPDYFKVTDVAANDVLNIREMPDAAAAKIGEIAPDADGIRNLGCEGGLSFAEWQAASTEEREAARHQRWCRISFDGVEGWVAGRFLAEGSGPAPGDAGPGPWRLLTLNGQPAVGDAEFLFASDGSISGSTGCNRFHAQGVMDGKVLVVDGPVAMTKMACPGDAVTAQEDRITGALQGRIELAFDPFSRELELINQASDVTLRLATQ